MRDTPILVVRDAVTRERLEEYVQEGVKVVAYGESLLGIGSLKITYLQEWLWGKSLVEDARIREWIHSDLMCCALPGAEIIPPILDH